MIAIEPIVIHFGHLKDRKAQGLAGDRRAVRASSPDFLLLLNHGNAETMLGGLHRSPFSTRARTNNYHIEIEIIHVALRRPEKDRLSGGRSVANAVGASP